MDKFVTREKNRTADGCKDTEAGSSKTNSSSSRDLQIENEADNKELMTRIGKQKSLLFQKWQSIYPWLALNPGGKAICSTCIEATNKKLPLPTNSYASISRNTWVKNGFDCWKNAILSFKKHEKSELHRQAAVGIAAMKKQSVVYHISAAKQKEMEQSRIALSKLFGTVNVLAQQGLALRGDNNDETSNLIKFLQMRAEDVPELDSWLKRSKYKWLHHDSINEMLEIMANDVTRINLTDIKNARYFSIILDETSDISRIEQVSISIRIVTRELEVREIFMGLYKTNDTKSETLFNIVRDFFSRCDLDIHNLRGQCFDGAKNVSGRLTGLQARIREVEPRALYIHCVAHTLNLVVQDAMERVTVAKNFIGIMKELINFIRDSPKRLAAFKSLQTAENPILSPFCPTRWCMRIKSLKTVQEKGNYEAAMLLFEEMRTDQGVDSAISAKAAGFLTQLAGFEFYFFLTVAICVLDRIEVLNAELQKCDLSVNESSKKVKIVMESLREVRETGYDLVWQKAPVGAKELDLEEPKLPRARRVPKRFQTTSREENHIFTVPKEYFRKQFYELLDQVLVSLQERFNSDTAELLNKFEDFIVGRHKSAAELIGSYYKPISETTSRVTIENDFDSEKLQLHRDMFLDMISQRKLEMRTLKDVVLFLQANPSVPEIFTEFTKFIKLMLTIPASSCTAERSFSALRRLKTYMRSSMLQSRMNHLAVLHVHSDTASHLDRDAEMDEFILRNNTRKTIFALSSAKHI